MEQYNVSVINHDLIHPGNIPQEISDALKKIRLTLAMKMFHFQRNGKKVFFPTKEQIFLKVQLISEPRIMGLKFKGQRSMPLGMLNLKKLDRISSDINITVAYFPELNHYFNLFGSTANILN